MRKFFVLAMVMLMTAFIANAKIKIKIRGGGANGFKNITDVQNGEDRTVTCAGKGFSECPASYGIQAEYGQDGLDLFVLAQAQISGGNFSGTATQGGVQITWIATSVSDYDLELTEI
jgi:hypothetical protein